MAVRTLSDLANTTQDALLAGIIDTLKVKDQLTAALIANARVTDRPGLTFNRSASNPTPVVADCSTTFTTQSISANNYSVDLLTYAVQFGACSIGQNLYSSFDDVLAREMDGALKGMSDKIRVGATGNGNGSTDIYGLGSFAANEVTCAVSGSPDVSDLDAMIDSHLAGDAAPIFAGSPAVIRKIVKELRSEASMQWGELAGTALNTPTYRGINLVTATGLDATKLYLFSPAGYALWFGEKQDQDVGGIFGMQNLGTSQTKMEQLYRLYAHLAGVSENPQGLVVLKNVA